MKFAVIVVAFNRVSSTKRLLESICRCKYDDECDLIISIDYSEKQKNIIDIAQEIKWGYGEKIVKAFNTNQGLKKHILKCGDLTEKYDAVIVLEDDITVAENYYYYVKQSIEFYSKDDRIAGISLYQHCTIQNTGLYFTPENNGYDAYLMQVAQSWGQCWTRSMWQAFREWYKNNHDTVSLDMNIPEYITKWDNRSWLKFFNKYIIEKNKFFVYPYYALSTNHSEAGEHCNYENNDYQVPMLYGVMNYRFPTFDTAVKYDAFFERIGVIEKFFPTLTGKTLLDLNGGRTLYGDANILISTNILPYKVLGEFALKYRPIEENLRYQDAGQGIFIYDLLKKSKKPNTSRYILSRYHLRAIHWKRTLQHGLLGLFEAIMIRIRKWI